MRAPDESLERRTPPLAAPSTPSRTPVASRQPRVAVVVVNYRSAGLTVDCVRSLQRSEGVMLEIIVVDNSSGDGSAEQIRSELPPDVALVESPVNGGYTGGNNIGIAVARERAPDWIFLVNNDTLVAPDCIARLVAAAERDPRIAMVSPLILFGREGDLLWFGGSRFNDWTGRVVHVGWKRPASAAMPPSEIPFATGCALLLRPSAIERIGLLDESLFGYAEDLDWSLRARQAGYRLRFEPGAVIRHLEGIGYRRAGGEALRQYLSSRNTLRVLARYLRWYQWPTALITFVIDHLGRFTLLSLRRRDLAALRGTWRGVLHAFTGGRSRIERAAGAAKGIDAPAPES
jgi:GT2 family glycosyltransferase